MIVSTRTNLKKGYWIGSSSSTRKSLQQTCYELWIHFEDWKLVLALVDEGATVDGDYYLRILKKHLSVIRRLSSGWKFTGQQHVARCHTANLYTNYLNENVQDYIKKEIWPPNLCDLIEKMVCQNVKRYEHIEVLPAVISVTWDRLTKNSSIIQSTNGGCLYVLIMSRTRFRVNPHSTVVWKSRNSLLEAGANSEV